MTSVARGPRPEGGSWLRQRVGWLREEQHRDSLTLLANNALFAAGGLLFWLLLVRVARLPPHDVGVAYAIVALGTIIGVLAKGGLDTALLRCAAVAHTQAAQRLLRLAVLCGASLAALLAAGVAVVGLVGGPRLLGPRGWIAVAAIGILLAVTWLQDAWFLARGDARRTLQRGMVFTGARVVLAVPIAMLPVAYAAAWSWALALAASAAMAVLFSGRVAPRDGRDVPIHELWRSANRNIAGSAAEVLPGLLLTPLVLALEGPAAAAYFGIAWALASLLFMAAGAIARSALAHFVRTQGAADGVRRALKQMGLVVAPAAVLGALLAPAALSLFGASYAQGGAWTLVMLCASALAVGPWSLYLAILRARERAVALVLFPVAMIALLAVLVPLCLDLFGLPGAALAWLLSNLPFGAYAVLRLRSEARGVSHAGAAVGGPAHAQ